jgi:hypothetical protein
MVHEGKWQVIKTDDGHVLAIPPQMDMLVHPARGPSVTAA